jgi:hypothetical protein
MEFDMRTKITSNNFLDSNGKPAGGTTFGNGFAIGWQNGPLGSGDGRIEPNGAFVEDVIAAAEDRLQFYQNNGFACDENAKAIGFLKDALGWLDSRTKRGVAAGVEGTHKGN